MPDEEIRGKNRGTRGRRYRVKEHRRGIETVWHKRVKINPYSR